MCSGSVPAAAEAEDEEEADAAEGGACIGCRFRDCVICVLSVKI